MSQLETLRKLWSTTDKPFLIYKNKELSFQNVYDSEQIDLTKVKAGDVVAIIGDFNPTSIQTLLRLIDLQAIIVPLTIETAKDHIYFFDASQVDVVIENNSVTRRQHSQSHPFIDHLRKVNHGGLVLFSTGSTGKPKAILHDLTLFLKRFATPRPTLQTINFLLFDHIGGINTLLHTLYNKGTVVAPELRTVESVIETCQLHKVELLPTTPTFLRMILLSGYASKIPPYVKVVTYGTERMDLSTLIELCKEMPHVDFRQTYGMSELGILRVKSVARDSLFMKIGGEGIETKVVENVLHIRSESRMIGYLNADSPFDENNWYDTKDVIEESEGAFKIVGRLGDLVNVGGLKFMASEVEKVALQFNNIAHVKAYPKQNPITGQHIEILVEPLPNSDFKKESFKEHLSANLQPHMMPKRITIQNIAVGHRFKKL